MKNIFSALFFSLFGATALMTSCSDVPAPYEIMSPGDIELVGDGSKDNPYNVATAAMKQDGSTAWVQGYIVGVMETNVDPFSPNFAAPFNTESNLMIADSPEEQNKKNCIIVQLPVGDIRTALNLKAHADNLGKPVSLQGKLTAYFSSNGLKEVTAATFNGEEIGSEGTPTDKDNPFGLNASNPVESFKADFQEQPDFVQEGNFNSNKNYNYELEGWKNVAFVGDRKWSGVVNKDNTKYIEASANKGKEERYEIWFVSPAFKVDAVADKKVSFDCAGAYFNEKNSLKVFFLELVDGKMVQEEIAVEGMPASKDHEWVRGLSADIAKYSGKVGFIGFQYISYSASSTTYRLDNIQTGNGEGGEVVPPAPGEEVVITKDAPYTEAFETSMGKFTIEDKNLSELKFVWKHDSERKFMKASAHNGKANEAESWFVSPVINLTKVSKATLNFEQAVNFAQGTAADALSLIAKEEGASNWEKINITYPEKDSWDFVPSGDIDLTKYAGKKIQLAFKYTSTATVASTWELKNFNIKAGKGDEGGEVVPPTPGDNLLTNSNFENWTEGKLEAWGRESVTNTKYTQSQDAKDGKLSVLMPGSNSNSRLGSQDITLETGTYRLSVYAKNANGKAKFRMGWVPIENGSPNTSKYNYLIDSTELINEWSQYTAEFTLETETTISIFFVNSKSKTENDLVIDQATLQKI